MKLDIKALISRIEQLGLDTQPLREFYVLLAQPGFNYKPYIHAIATLRNQTSKELAPNSRPTAIALLLRQLDKKIKSKAHLVEESTPTTTSDTSIDLGELKHMIEDSVRSMSGQTVDLNKELLKAVDNLNNSVKQIKKSDNYQDSSPEPGMEIERVFVNPIDDKKVDSIKANVNIATKKSTNIKSKVDRLKKLSKTK